MRLSDNLLRLVAQRTPFSNRIEPIVASDGSITLRCDLRGSESVGCLLTQIDLVQDSKREFTPKQLNSWAESICNRITYLLEPLTLIELDDHHGTAVVRSRKPQSKEDKLAYYEMLADRTRHATLRRYRYSWDTRSRDAVAFALTHDQLEVLVDDLVSTVEDFET